MTVIPTNGFAPAQPVDIVPPLQQLLQGLNLLGQTVGVGPKNDDLGADVLEQDAPKLVKFGSTVVTGLGGLAAIGAALSSFFGNTDRPSRVVLVAGLALVAIAAFAAAGYVVATDLRVRTAGAKAIYEVRQAISLEYLRLLQSGQTTQSSGTSTQADPSAAATSTPTSISVSEAAVIALAANRIPAAVSVVGGGHGTLDGLSHQENVLKIHLIDPHGDARDELPGALTIDGWTYKDPRPSDVARSD